MPSEAIRRVDVLVVGAGPIGLSMACHLRRLGLSVRLVEKRSSPSEHSKAIGLQYRVSEVLSRMGIVDRFTAKGSSPTSVNIYAGSQRLVQLRFVAPAGMSGPEAFQPAAILLPQSETEAILIDHFQDLGGSIEWNTEFLGYEQDATGIVARVRNAESASFEIRADWLISCEGAHSIVRKQSGMQFQGKTYPLAFFMADVRLSGSLTHEENHVWLHQDGSLAALPLPASNTWRLFVEVTRQASKQSGVTLDDLRRFMAERAPNIDARISGDPLWLSDFRINCRMVDRMHIGRAFVAGDAAHIHSPTGGQGITTGMQDAENLAWKLARVSQGAPVALLETYDEERLPQAAEVLRETNRTTSIFFAPSPVLRAIRDWLVLPILRRAWVQRRMFGKLSQLHTHYRQSSLSVDTRARWHRGGVRAGDRSPDVAFTRSNGEVTTLFALMRRMRPVVLFRSWPDAALLQARLRRLDVDGYVISDGQSSAPPGVDMLVDQHGTLTSMYGLRQNDLCLIRPDGHVGLITASHDERALRQYLGKICDGARLIEAFAGPS